MLTGIWYFSLSILKCVCLIVEMKSLIVHMGSIINSLNPLGLMMDWIGGSAFSRLSAKSPSDLSVSKPSSLVEGEVANGFLSSLKVLGLF